MSAKFSILGITFVLLVGVALSAGADPVPADLATWMPEDQPNEGLIPAAPGNWNVDMSGSAVVQTVNGLPTFLVSPGSVQTNRIRATLSTGIPTGFDDNDLFGIAVGFTGANDSASDYLLIDWRQENQSIDWMDGTGSVTGESGLRVSRVTGVPTLGELWGHVDDAPGDGAVNELDVAMNLGHTGWIDGQSYDFDIEFTPSSLKVWVDGLLEISINGDFSPGAVAFYNFSQADFMVADVSLNESPATESAAMDVTVDEGTLGSTGGSFVDDDPDTLSISCSTPCFEPSFPVGAFVTPSPATWTWSQMLLDDASFTVDVVADDGDWPIGDTFVVTVDNVNPTITAKSSLPSGLADNSTLNVSADFSDPGTLDTHTGTFSWGDGTSTPAVVAESDGSGRASGSHAYQEPGEYTISLELCDDDEGCTTTSFGAIFVFDPDDFVTGGGWVTSPADAWIDDRAHTGKLTFGFVVRYDHSGDVRGNLQVQLHKGLNLHSSSFDTLFISDGVAEFTGEGLLNGEPGAQFRVIAFDQRHVGGSEDRLWVEISDPGGLIYDGSVYPTDGLPIVGRGIQVHDRP